MPASGAWRFIKQQAVHQVGVATQRGAAAVTATATAHDARRARPQLFRNSSTPKNPNSEPKTYGPVGILFRSLVKINHPAAIPHEGPASDPVRRRLTAQLGGYSELPCAMHA